MGPVQFSQQSDLTLGGVTAQIGSFSGVTGPAVSSSRQRLSDCRCFICKERLGADNSKRIGLFHHNNLDIDYNLTFSLYEARLLPLPCPPGLYQL